MHFTPIKMVYHFENKSVSLVCFLLATSFSSGRGNAGILTNLYRTKFNICTNSWQIRRSPQCNLPQLKWFFLLNCLNETLLATSLETTRSLRK